MKNLWKLTAKGSRRAMALLLARDGLPAYQTALLLLNTEEAAVEAVTAAAVRIFTDAVKEKKTDADFGGTLLKRTVRYCKKQILKTEPAAFGKQETVQKLGMTYTELVCLQLFSLGYDAADAARFLELPRKFVETAFHGVAGSVQTAETLPQSLFVRVKAELLTLTAPYERRRTAGVVSLALAVVLMLGAAGAALWRNRETIVTWLEETLFYEEPVYENDGVVVDESLVTHYADLEIRDYGTIRLALYGETAPETVKNFVSLAKSGFYEGVSFHRILNGFMMQGGDPDGDGIGGSDKTIFGEFAANGFENPLSHIRGAVSMWRNSFFNAASSQFFIVQQDSVEALDGQYACFGYVVSGLHIVDEICAAARPEDANGTILEENRPIMENITILTPEEAYPTEK